MGQSSRPGGRARNISPWTYRSMLQSPSLISLMVFVDVKRHVYLPAMLQSAKVTGCQWGENPSLHALKHFTCAILELYRFTGYGIVARIGSNI